MTFDPFRSGPAVPGTPPPAPNYSGYDYVPDIRVRKARKIPTVAVLSAFLGLSLLINVVSFFVIADLRTSSEAPEAPAAEAPAFEGTLSPLDIENEFETGEEEKKSISEVYESAINSVVTIFCGDWSGTGFAFAIAAPSGSQTIVVTNHHVVEDCLGSGDTVDLLEINGSYSEGYVWSHHESRDLALVATNVRLAPLYPSSGAAVGDQVVAIGSPGGLEGTLTQGIVSAIRDGVYQTDAAINFGNSGGPLLDLYGRVVAVNTAIDRDSVGIGFAVGIDLLCERLMSC